MTHGGRRIRSGRHRRETYRIRCSLTAPVYQELIRQEKLTGIYRCQIVARLITEHLVAGIVDSELKAVVRAQPARQGRNGSEPLPEKMRRSFASFHW